MDSGADGFEFDVALTKDLEPVVIHIPFYSSRISHLVNAPMRLSNTTWSDLQRASPQSEPILHFYDLAEFIAAHDIECFLEPKRNDPILTKKLVVGMERFGLLRKISLITFYLRRDILKGAKQLNPNVRTSVILISPFGSWPEAAVRAAADAVIPGWKLWNHQRFLSSMGVDMDRKLNQTLAAGINVYSGEADDEKELNWLCRLGVTGLFTNDVPLARKVVDSYETNS